jgi:ATP-dependent DNA helicase RecG
MKIIKNLSTPAGLTESSTVEWKQSLSEIKEIVETVAAFSNTEGGNVFAGVSNNGEIAGVQIGKGTLENLANQISQHTDPKIHPRISVRKTAGKEVVVIHVRKSIDGLTLAFGRPYIRVGKTTMKMSKDEYERLILEKHGDKFQFDFQPCKSAGLKDIDPGKVQWFLNKAREMRGFDIPSKISVKEALERLDLLYKNKLTNAAVLLFGKNPQKYFAQASIRCGRLKGVSGGNFIDMKVIGGTIPQQREDVMKFIVEHIKHAVYFDANRRYDKWEYPLRALEEVVANALAHRDYLSNADIQLSIYDDRIELWNPGELPKPLTPNDLKRKHKSFPRNKLLADKLFLIKHIEQWGMGTNRVVDDMKQSNLPEPDFHNITGGFEVILTGPGRSFEKDIEKEKLHELNLNKRQQKAVDYMAKNGSISRSQYMAMNRVSHTIAHQELKELLEKKIVRTTGAGKYLKYELTQG